MSADALPEILFYSSYEPLFALSAAQADSTVGGQDQEGGAAATCKVKMF
jgi:hypothetical protein